MNLYPTESIAWIKKRRSVFPKMFDANSSISEEEILKLLEAARWAPTHKLTQPWRFVVFMDKGMSALTVMQIELIQKSGNDGEAIQFKIAKLEQKAKQSCAIVAIVMQRDVEKRVPEWEEISAVACAVQNVALHASSLGLAGYWSTGTFTNHEEMREYLNLEGDDLHLGWFYLGRSEATKEAKRVRRNTDEFVELRKG